MKFVKKISLVVILLLSSSVFAVAQTGSVKGKVRDIKGNSLEAVTVDIRQDGKSIQTVETDRKGKFFIKGMEPGLYTLVFDKSGFSTGALTNVEIRSKKTRNLSEGLIMKVDQGTLIIVEASVYNHNGFSLYGAKVVIEEILSDGTTKKVGSGYSSKDGEAIFRFAEKPTTYRITASVKGISESKDVEVNEAALYRASITLDLSKDN